jgi:transcriptional regulator PpsR
MDLSALAPLAPELASTMARVASDIALVIDAQGVIRNVAEGTAALSPSCAAWVGQAWADTASADSRPKIENLLREVQETGVGRRREVNHPVADGQDLPLAWSAIRLGTGGAVIAVGRDLRAVAAIQQRFLDTQRELERAYWQRRQAGTRHRLLYQAAHDAMFVLDATTLQVIEANDPAIDRIGVALTALIGRGIVDLLPIPSRAAVMELLASARGTGHAAEIRVALNAHEPAADLLATPFRAGDRMRLLLRARHDEPGEETLSAMADAVDEATDGVVIVDAAGRIAMANAAFLQRMRLADEAQAKGRPLADLVGDAAPAWLDLLGRVHGDGVVARERLDVGVHGRGVENLAVTASLLAESEQEAVGLVIAAGTARRAPSRQPIDALLATLQHITAQIGHLTLPELVDGAARATEKHLIEAAVQRSGGLVPMAAQLLGLTPEHLTLRLRELGLSSRVTAGNDLPPSIN